MPRLADNNLKYSIDRDPLGTAWALVLRARGYSLESFIAFPEVVEELLQEMKMTSIWDLRDRMFAIRKKGGMQDLPKPPHWHRPPEPIPQLKEMILTMRPEKNRDSEVGAIRYLHKKFPTYSEGYINWAFIKYGKKGRVGNVE